MKANFLVVIFIGLFFIVSTAIGQNVKMDDGLIGELQKSGVIKKHNEITGYYFFYKIKERNRQERMYYLDILDQDLKTISKKKIIGSKSLNLINSAFNGQYFMFKYIDSKERKIIHKMYDEEANLISVKVKNISKKVARMYLNIEETDKSTPELIAIPNKGFLSYTFTLNPKNSYQIDFFSSEDENKDWSVNSNENSAFHKTANLFTFNEDVVISLVNIQSTISNDNLQQRILAHNIQTGEQQFQVDLKDDKYTIDLTSGELIAGSNELLLIGEFHQLNANPSKKSSLGLFTYKMNLFGEIIDRKYHLWSESDHMAITENNDNKKNKKTSIWFHDFIHTSDGSIIVVGEKYRKAVDGAGVAINILDIFLGVLMGYNSYGANESMTKIVIEDMFIYKFSPEFELDTTIVINKNQRDFQLASGSSFLSTRALGQYIVNIGGFDYAFTQLNEKGDDFAVIYMSDKFSKDRYEKTICGVVKYENGEIIQQETPMDFYSNSEIINMYPATDGYVLFTEYFYKEDKIDNRFLKLK